MSDAAVRTLLMLLDDAGGAQSTSLRLVTFDLRHKLNITAGS